MYERLIYCRLLCRSVALLQSQQAAFVVSATGRSEWRLSGGFCAFRSARVKPIAFARSTDSAEDGKLLPNPVDGGVEENVIKRSFYVAPLPVCHLHG